MVLGAIRRWLKGSGVGRFLRFYYILNIAAICTYVFARKLAYRSMPSRELDNMSEWEKSAFSSLAILLAVKAVRTLTMDAFMSDVFMFSKSVILFMAWNLEPRLFAWYLILFSVLFLMVPQPFFEGPEDIVYLTPATFDTLIKRKGLPKKDPPDTGGEKVRWLVEFYANWSPPCVHLDPVFAALSVQYTTETLQFGKMDLGRWPLIAKEFNIHTGGTSKQLPTLILFEGGLEVGRIPHRFSDGSIAKGRYRKADIIKAFDLDHKNPVPASNSKNGKNERKKNK
mmetsp:Transcript_4339/g.5795  ORF Transcript_4339/g.5795 Transcript_4339/m.5795 type:complete len:283 (+) Transcript_4339:101-949(+)